MKKSYQHSYKFETIEGILMGHAQNLRLTKK